MIFIHSLIHSRSIQFGAYQVKCPENDLVRELQMMLNKYNNLHNFSLKFSDALIHSCHQSASVNFRGNILFESLSY